MELQGTVVRNIPVDILLAAYNGEKYLNEQIQSVLNQTHKNFRLLIRDDCSQDGTQVILQHWSSLYPDKIVILPSDSREGAKGNFSVLMGQAESPYILFCDQDDIWMKDKVEKSLDLMLKTESKYGKSIPCLVHTDLKVVSEDLTSIADSFWNFSRLNPQADSFHRLLMQNTVTGCTALINKSLFNLLRNIPNESIMHDWWTALVASAFGRIAYLCEPTVLYRQHKGNVIGAQKFGTVAHLKKALKTLRYEGRTYQIQAKAFHEKYHAQLDRKSENALKAYLSLPNCSWTMGRYKILRYRLFKQGWLRNFAAFFLQKYTAK